MMRCVLGFLLALTGLPAAVNAQMHLEAELGEQARLALIPEHLEKRQPGYRSEHRAAPTSPDEQPEPALSADEKKIRNAKIGIGVSGAAALAGAVMAAAASGPVIDLSSGSSSDSGGDAVVWAGTAVAAAGAASLIATGILLGVRKRKPRDSKETARRKIQWDLTGSRLVF